MLDLTNIVAPWSSYSGAATDVRETSKSINRGAETFVRKSVTAGVFIWFV